MDVNRELEHLKKLAQEDPTRRFNRLYRLLRQPDLLVQAQQRIAHNKGANTPGVDGQVLADITPLALTRLSDELAAGSYRPQPVRRTYIPKRNGTLRPLGIPASRDRIVQAGITLILEALYEPLFRPSSHGYRAGHSPLTALRQVSQAYRAGTSWVIEGDITDCFGSLPHQVILTCLRKRIRDERFIDLIRQLLQSGVMEAGTVRSTYSGTPQGGVVSPILSNIVLHELDQWLETQWDANPAPLRTHEQNARSNPAYMRLHYRITDIRRYLDGKRPLPKGASPEALREELRTLLRQRRQQPRLLPRRALYYTRYADDFVLLLCHASKSEAEQLKTALEEWLHNQLGLTLSPDKTLITHWRSRLYFLGYELEGRANHNGTHWLHLAVPKAAVREVVAKIKRATAYPQAPSYDVFNNINRLARGWSNYYRYAHTISAVGNKLAVVIFWRTAHYLAKKHRCSIAHIVRQHYGRCPGTGCQALYIYQPGEAPSARTRYFVWHKPPHRLSWTSCTITTVEDTQASLETAWARGRSRHQRREALVASGQACEQCGTHEGPLAVHHPNRLHRIQRVKKGSAAIAASGMEQQTKVLCHACHVTHHRT